MSIFIEHEKRIYDIIFQNIIGKEDNLEELCIEYYIKHDFNFNKEFRITTKFTKFEVKESQFILDFNNLVYSRTTLLVEACRSNSIKVVKFLLEKNVNINYQDPERLFTPLMFTIESNNDVITKMILDTNRYDAFLKNKEGQNLLQYTFANGYRRKKYIYTFSELVILVSKYVLNKGISLEKKNKYFYDRFGRTILDSVNFQIKHRFLRDLNELNKLKVFYEIYNENFKEKKYAQYPSSLKNKIVQLLMINNKEKNIYYLPIEIWLYTFTFIRLIDYY